MHFRNTRIHAAGIRLVVTVQTVVQGLPRGNAAMADQIRRASTSVVLNFAEGSSRATKKERRRFFDIARGSVFEVAAALDVCHALHVIDEEAWAEAIQQCDRLSAMLYSYH